MYKIGQLVGLVNSQQYVKILAKDLHDTGIQMYWCKATPGTKYYTFREEDLRELQ